MRRAHAALALPLLLLLSLWVYGAQLQGPHQPASRSLLEEKALLNAGVGQQQHGVGWVGDPHAAIDAWLQQYFRSRGPEQGGAGTGRSAALQHQHQRGQPPPGQGRYVDLEELRAIMRPGKLRNSLLGNLTKSSACSFEGAPRPQRRQNLILAPVGDGFDAALWMTHSEHASYDLILVHYGSSTAFSCPLCKKVFKSKGPKWRLVHQVWALPEWRELTAGYRAIMVADDDLEMDTCVLNRAFEIFHEHGLLLAQPSLCNSQKAYSAYKIVFQQPGFILRYTTFVEIMAPIFDIDMYNGLVGPILHNAYTGWGLDFLVPFLLKFPRRRIAVIDEVCIFHPHSSDKSGPSLYEAEAPYGRWEEQARREAEFGYFESALAALGYPLHPVLLVGAVLKPPPPPPPPLTALDRANRWVSGRLGHWYPVVLLGETVLILTVLLLASWQRVCPGRRRGAGGRARAGAAY